LLQTRGAGEGEAEIEVTDDDGVADEVADAEVMTSEVRALEEETATELLATAPASQTLSHADSKPVEMLVIEL
jgi:hypothetical protein